MGAPQIGPGKSAPFEKSHSDAGRYLVTGDPADMFAFRTPSLRNVALTAPYGHAGGHAKLVDFIADHADPVTALARFDEAKIWLPQFEGEDFVVMRDPDQISAIAAAVRTTPIALSDADIADIAAFLDTLTDPAGVNGRLGIPDTVPSGLPVQRH